MFTDYPSQCATISYGQLWERVVYMFVVYVYRLSLTVCYNRLLTALGELFTCLLFMFTDYPSQVLQYSMDSPGRELFICLLFMFTDCLFVCCLCLQITPHSVLQ